MKRFRTFWVGLWNISYIKHPVIGLLLLLFLLVSVFLLLRIFTRHAQEFPVPDFRTLSLADARVFATEKNLILVVADSSYVLTRRLGEILEQSPPSGDLVKKGRRVFLTINAVLPQMVTAPNIEGETIRQALIQLEQRGLYAGRLSFVPDIALSTVLQMSFKGKRIYPNDSIPKESRVDLLLGKGFDEISTKIPSLIDQTLHEAWNALALNSLNVGRIRFDETVKSLADSLSARVYSTFPQCLSDVPMPLGASVDLWLTLNASRISAVRLKESDDHAETSMSE